MFYSFGLLGASGCGKTTLLRCILSSLEPDYGEITVLGMKPGITFSRVPGRDVGYMPQVLCNIYDIFLLKFSVFSISASYLLYFGLVFPPYLAHL